MQLTVKGKQLDVGDALRTHVRDALSHILDKYFGSAIEATVTLSREKHRYRTVVVAHVGRGIQLHAQGEADSPYQAFDTAADHLAKRLRRYKRRLRDHHKEAAGAAEAMIARQYILAEHDEAEPADDGGADTDTRVPVVVAEMTTEIPWLSVSEAVMRMDLADQPVLLFRNSAHNGLNLVYRRPDGHIGWIDPRGNRDDQPKP
ncbi:MAG: ribosome-associated translation inhibitor RaiA [Planctomycetota bacterium]|nr:MAG: ribosome-associated translation inhibitor RaiA [Planctomycetota bacterium]